MNITPPPRPLRLTTPKNISPSTPKNICPSTPKNISHCANYIQPTVCV